MEKEKRTRPLVNEREYRYMETEVRIDEAKPMLVGYAAVFDQWADIWGGPDNGGFREKVSRGAFAKTIQEADIRSLFNHDANLVLGRNRAGTLRLLEDEFGLKTETDINLDDPDGTKTLAKVKRGDVSQMSFAFRTVKETWDKEYTERELLEVKLYDVSPVTYPAYPQTSISARAELMDYGINVEALSGMLFRIDKGAALKDSEKEIIEQTIEALRKILPEPENIHSTEPVTSHSVDIEILRRRLELTSRTYNLR